jgi:hypothetical protein
MFQQFYNHVVATIRQNLISSGFTDKFFAAYPDVIEIHLNEVWAEGDEIDREYRYTLYTFQMADGSILHMDMDDNTQDTFSSGERNFDMIDWPYMRTVEKMMFMVPFNITITRGGLHQITLSLENTMDVIIPNSYFMEGITE